jgi:hypothetical protein
MAQSILSQIDDVSWDMSILEAKNYLEEIAGGVDSRLDDIRRRLDSGEDEYADY